MPGCRSPFLKRGVSSGQCHGAPFRYFANGGAAIFIQEGDRATSSATTESLNLDLHLMAYAFPTVIHCWIDDFLK